ncbi:hypothetical protein COBT_001092 [Conglomerata obtusa]
MLSKKDIVILQPLTNGLFFKNYVIKVKNRFYETRCMKKSQIINLNLQDLIMHEKRRPRHRYIHNVVCTMQDYDTLFLVTDLPQCGYLYYYLRKYKTFSKKVCVFFAAQIICAFQYLHSKNIIYKLLSPDNIMITADGNIKLRFDFCNMLGLTEEEYVKNVEYIPIDYYKDGITKSSDYWALGVVLFEFLYGQTPFKDESWEKCLMNVKNRKIDFRGDEDTQNLLRGLLERHDFKRIGSRTKDRKKIRKMMFFKGIVWDDIENGNISSPFINHKPVIFNCKGKKMCELYESDLQKREGDGYGATFFGYEKIESDIDHHMDLN